MIFKSSSLFKLFIMGIFFSSTYAADDHHSAGEKTKDAVVPLFSIPLTPIKPGVYQSDSMEIILSNPLREFGRQDAIIFDVDETLITGLDPYFFVHYSKKSPLHERLFSQDKSVRDKFFLYMLLTKPWTLMEENLPRIIRALQLQEVKCIANTATNPAINPELSVDVPTFRVQNLRSLGIDFSGAFPHLLSWDFDGLDSKHVPNKRPPLFKEGVILSSETPKYVSTLELFKKLGIKPRRILYVDDFLEKAQEMYEGLSAHGFECFAFFYSKKDSKPLHSYFSAEVFSLELQRLEAFIEKLLTGENTDEIFRRLSD